MKDPEIWSIVSGKGGVGKTTVAKYMAYILADQGNRVLLMDADHGDQGDCANKLNILEIRQSLLHKFKDKDLDNGDSYAAKAYQQYANQYWGFLTEKKQAWDNWGYSSASGNDSATNWAHALFEKDVVRDDIKETIFSTQTENGTIEDVLRHKDMKKTYGALTKFLFGKGYSSETIYTAYKNAVSTGWDYLKVLKQGWRKYSISPNTTLEKSAAKSVENSLNDIDNLDQVGNAILGWIEAEGEFKNLFKDDISEQIVFKAKQDVEFDYLKMKVPQLIDEACMGNPTFRSNLDVVNLVGSYQVDQINSSDMEKLSFLFYDYLLQNEPAHYDYVLVDHGAGANCLTNFLGSKSNKVVVVLEPYMESTKGALKALNKMRDANFEYTMQMAMRSKSAGTNEDLVYSFLSYLHDLNAKNHDVYKTIEETLKDNSGKADKSLESLTKERISEENHERLIGQIATLLFKENEAVENIHNLLSGFGYSNKLLKHAMDSVPKISEEYQKILLEDTYFSLKKIGYDDAKALNYLLMEMDYDFATIVGSNDSGYSKVSNVFRNGTIDNLLIEIAPAIIGSSNHKMDPEQIIKIVENSGVKVNDKYSLMDSLYKTFLGGQLVKSLVQVVEGRTLKESTVVDDSANEFSSKCVNYNLILRKILKEKGFDESKYSSLFTTKKIFPSSEESEYSQVPFNDMLNVLGQLVFVKKYNNFANVKLSENRPTDPGHFKPENFKKSVRDLLTLNVKNSKYFLVVNSNKDGKYSQVANPFCNEAEKTAGIVFKHKFYLPEESDKLTSGVDSAADIEDPDKSLFLKELILNTLKIQAEDKKTQVDVLVKKMGQVRAQQERINLAKEKENDSRNETKGVLSKLSKGFKVLFGSG